MTNEDTSASTLSSALIGGAISGTLASIAANRRRKKTARIATSAKKAAAMTHRQRFCASHSRSAPRAGYISTFSTVVATAPLMVTEKRLMPALKCSRSDSRFTRASKA